MSHQVKQVGKVAVQDIELLRRACDGVFVAELGTSLKLDTEKKAARYYSGNSDPCDAVITFARQLNGAEANQYYEIALKFEPAKTVGPDEVPSHYALWADTSASDRTMKDRIKRIFQAYRVEELKAAGQYVGAVSECEIEGKPGWRRVRVEVP